MKFILGKKLGMTQVFLPSGEVVPVTKVLAGPCYITALREEKEKSQKMVQIGFGETKEFRLKRPEAGHLKDLSPVRHLREVAVESLDNLKRGDQLDLETFVTGDRVDVIGESKGKGFAGVVKRHHFAGGPASHGHKDNLRAPGSIGAGGVQRVFKGMRMAGHMGSERVTVKNLEVIEVHPDTNELLIKGAVPGARNGLLFLIGEGELKVKTEAIAEEVKVEEAPVVTETTNEETVVAPVDEAVVSEAPAESPAPETKNE